MGKYTYTASLVDESISILKRADQELSGTSAAVLNAVNTILNARGADRLTMDFSDILDITDFARDDINAVTKEIINKQNEIEEYEKYFLTNYVLDNAKVIYLENKNLKSAYGINDLPEYETEKATFEELLEVEGMNKASSESVYQYFRNGD